MITVIKTEDCYIPHGTNNAIQIKRLSIDDRIISDKLYNVEDIKPTLKTTYKITSLYSETYGFSNTKIKYRSLYDFSEDYNYLEKDAKNLNINEDYIYLPKFSLDSFSSKFDISKYLYQGKYDFSIIKEEVINKLKLPSWFVFESLLHGVPEHEDYNSKLDVYLKLNNYQSSDQFRDVLIKENSVKISKNLNITNGLIDIIILVLYGQYKTSTHKKVELFIDDKILPNCLENIVLFLKKNNIHFKISNNIYNSSSVINISSFFIYNLITDCFNDFSIVNYFTKQQNRYFLSRLFSTNMISFSLKSLLNCCNLQQYFYKNKLLFSIEKLEDNFILTPLSKDSYIELDEGFLIPISNIEKTEDSVFEIFLQPIEA